MSLSGPDLGRVCLRQLRRRAVQTRYSSTATEPRRRGNAIATFPPTSSPDIDKLIQTYRDNVFVPSHLRIPQKHLIYRKGWQHYLTGEEPIKVEIRNTDGVKEEFTLKPLAKESDEPNFKKSINQILNHLRGHPDDWKILPELLREFKNAGIKIKENQVAKTVRLARQAGKIGLMIQCFRRQEDLNFRLSNTEIARQMLLGAHEEVFGSEEALFEDEVALDRAIRHAEGVLLLIQDRRHILIQQLDDPKQKPDVYGSIFALIAVRRWLWETKNTDEDRARRAALKAQATTPESDQAEEQAAAVVAADGDEAAASENAPEKPTVTSGEDAYALGNTDMSKLETYAEELLARAETAELDTSSGVWRDMDELLARWLPTWFGIQVALKVLPGDSVLAKRLQGAFQSDIAPAVEKAVGACSAEHASKNPQIRLYKKYQQVLSG